MTEGQVSPNSGINGGDKSNQKIRKINVIICMHSSITDFDLLM